MLKLIERALEGTSRFVAGTRKDQYDLPTPCPEYDVRTLLNHIVGGQMLFKLAIDDVQVDASQAPPDLIGDDHVAAFERARQAVLDAWAQPGVNEKILKLPFGNLPGAVAQGIHFTEALVHGWDLAKATGQDPTLDPELAEACLNTNKMIVNDSLRGPGQPFGPEVKIGDDAPVADRLVAFLGRTP